jgi:hypothetical protein
LTRRLASIGHTARAAAVAGFFLLPLFFATAATGGALTPMASGEKVAFFDDFSSGALDPDRWSLPTGWGLEKTRIKPWDYPTLPIEDSAQPHLSDSLMAGGGRYRDSNRTWIETSWIDLSQAAGFSRMALYHRYDIDTSEDGAIVMARSELRGWSLLLPQSGYPTTFGFAGSALVYSVSNFDMSP